MPALPPRDIGGDLERPERSQTPADPAANASGSFAYDAFFSYSSVPDARLVRRTKRYLVTFHRQWLLRQLRLRPLTVCLDGEDFELRGAGAAVPVEATLQDYVRRSRYLVVFCSPGAAGSPYVAREIETFLEHRPAGAILPVLTTGDPAAAPEACFPRRLIEHRLHEAIWVDFRGARGLSGLPGKRRYRPFGEERVKLAAQLHDCNPSVVPAWKRAQTIRRGLAASLTVLVALVGSLAVVQSRRNSARDLASQVEQEITRGSAASIRDLRLRSADAVATFHNFETDRAYRQAASLVIRRLIPGEPTDRVLSLAQSGSGAIRLTDRGAIETTDDVQAGTWRQALAGTFAQFDSSDTGDVIAALDASGRIVVSHDGASTPCSAQPPAAIARAVAVEPGGERIAVLLQSGTIWSVAIGDPRTCAQRPLAAHQLWNDAVANGPGSLVRNPPEYHDVRVRLNRGGRALVVSSGEWWQAMRLDEDGSSLELLNPRLEAAWRTTLPALPVPGEVPAIAIVEEMFSADGRFLAVRGARTDVEDKLGQPVLVVPVFTEEEPFAVPASRGSRRIAVAKNAPLLAFAGVTTSHVRVWDWTTQREISRTLLPRGLVAAMTFAASDELLLIADSDVQPRLHVSDVRTGTILDRIDVSTTTSLESGGPQDTIARGAHVNATDLYQLQVPLLTARLASNGTTVSAADRGVLARLGDGTALYCDAAATECSDTDTPDAHASPAAAGITRQNGGSCISPASATDACMSIAIDPQAVTASAVSSDGKIGAVAQDTDSGSRLQVYRRSVSRWFPWPAWEPVLLATIDEPGRIRAIGLSAASDWIVAATEWREEIVVRRFPITAPAIAHTAGID